MFTFKDNNLENFQYNLPDAFIAKYPLENRDESKLLVYNNDIKEAIFKDLAQFVPANALIINNNSKVIPARLVFQKPSGGLIEIFCLEPLNNSFEEAMLAKQSSVWKCYVGGASKWTSTVTVEWEFNLENIVVNCKATLLEKGEDCFIIKFEWAKDVSFISILDYIGKIPIPPYLKRAAEASDKLNYQTIYAKIQGSVAAPTAGLHFTNAVMESLMQKGIETASLTLHVGAGTFKPITSQNISEHIMHAEWVQIDIEVIEKLLATILLHPIVCIGTTSLRSLESFYWWGMQCFQNNKLDLNEMVIPQFMPYVTSYKTPIKEMLQWVLSQMKNQNLSAINFKTQIMIAPGYAFKFCDILITNFHQPNSTLLLLISAFTNNNWQQIYNYALQKSFRFLSYGDSSILYRANR